MLCYAAHELYGRLLADRHILINRSARGSRYCPNLVGDVLIRRRMR